jgi:hypothetical protein
MAKCIQTIKKFKKRIIGEGAVKCKPYPNRNAELGMRDQVSRVIEKSKKCRRLKASGA